MKILSRNELHRARIFMLHAFIVNLAVIYAMKSGVVKL